MNKLQLSSLLKAVDRSIQVAVFLMWIVATISIKMQIRKYRFRGNLVRISIWKFEYLHYIIKSTALI